MTIGKILRIQIDNPNMIIYIYRAIKYITKKYRSKCDSILNKLQIKAVGLNFNTTWTIIGRLFILNHGKIEIGNNFRINSGKHVNPIGGDTVMRIIVKEKGMLSIGDNVGISNTTIVCQQEIRIGNNVFIGGGCKIWDTDFHSLDPIDRIHNGDSQKKTSPIIVKDYVFIGGSSIILKGVTIGKNSIIAAGSVVTRNIPDNEIWGGNPANRIRNI